jgi:molybdopterin/thiamine biosynthesis adenylyltransferase
MNDDQLLRYSRQIMLPKVDIIGQQKLLQSNVLIIGMGGLGSPAAMYLASAGVGHLTLCDHDHVELSNLQRQIAHSTEDIGKPKVQSAAQTLRALNPDVQLQLIDHRLQGEELHDHIKSADVVVDGSDNFTTRFQLNEACVRWRKPLVSGAAIRMEGQVSVFRADNPLSPCYRCVYKDEDEFNQTCSETGVLSPVVGIIGSIQATETLKILLNLGETLMGRLMLLDALSMEWRTIKLRKDPQCPVCAHPDV